MNTKITTYFFVILALAPPLFFSIVSSIYPNQRISYHWFEIATDGYAPDSFAEDARRILATLWMRIFKDGHIEKSGIHKVIQKDILQYISDSDTSSDDDNHNVHVDILELAAGSGVPALLWHELFTNGNNNKKQEDTMNPFSVRTVITDLQPTPKAWGKLVQDYYPSSSSTNNTNVNANANDERKSTISYIESSVDATSAASIMKEYYSDWGVRSGNNNHVEIRMIHLGLHHLKPYLVKEVFRDAVKSNAFILIGDLAPSIDHLFLIGELTFLDVLKEAPKVMFDNPLKLLYLPFLPLIYLVVKHDGMVSLLRSYSYQQLQDILNEVIMEQQQELQQEHPQYYTTQSFKMFSLGDHLRSNMPYVPQHMYDALQKPEIQFFWAVPPPLSERFTNHNIISEDVSSSSSTS